MLIFLGISIPGIDQLVAFESIPCALDPMEIITAKKKLKKNFGFNRIRAGIMRFLKLLLNFDLPL